MTTAQASLPEPIRHELDTRHQRLIALMNERDWSAVLLSRHQNVAWITAGRVDAHVGLGSETGACSLLMTRTGRRYHLAPNNEAARLRDEEFAGLDWEPAIYSWTDPNGGWDLAHTLGGPEIASDTPQPGFSLVSLTPLRAPLLPAEMQRFRALGADVAAATTRVLSDLEPGVDEDEMAAHLSADLFAQHITPTVLLLAVDQRILLYKHAVARNGELRHLAMLNFCGRRDGLVVSITRFVQFGAMPRELVRNFERATRINAALLHATRAGVTSADLYATAERAYAAEGLPGEIASHHQGGAAGYRERDWLALPGGTERVEQAQAFAWNPSVLGGKIEDAVLLQNGALENLTETPELPSIETEIEGKVYRSAGVLLR